MWNRLGRTAHSSFNFHFAAGEKREANELGVKPAVTKRGRRRILSPATQGCFARAQMT